MSTYKALILLSILCALSILTVTHAQSPGAYFSDDFVNFGEFSEKWTNTTAVSVGSPLASILNFSGGQVVSRTSYFQGVIEMRINASDEGNFFGFSDGLERLGFESRANQFFFVSQNETHGPSPVSVGSVDRDFHIFALVWFYVDTSSGSEQFAQACFDGICSWKSQTPVEPIPSRTLPIVLASNSSMPLQVDWVTYSYNGVFVSPVTVTQSVTITKPMTIFTTYTSSTVTTESSTRLITSQMIMQTKATTYTYTATQNLQSTFVSNVTNFTFNLSQLNSIYLAMGLIFIFATVIAYRKRKQQSGRKGGPNRVSRLVLDVIPLLVLVVILLNPGPVMNMTSRYLELLGFTFSGAILALIFPIVYDLPKGVGKATIILIDDIRRTLAGPREKQPIDSRVGVSVIVPAHNAEHTIEKCVGSILEASYDPKEVIVVDDGSVDNTYEKLLEFSRDRITVLRKEASGNRATPCNFGMQFASQPIYIFVDSDTFIFRNAIAEISEPLRDPKVAGVAGNVRIFNTTNLLTRMQAYEYMLSMECGRGFQSIVHTLLVVPGGFGAVRARNFRQIGGYDLSLAEDMEATLKMHKTRGAVVFAKEAIALTVAPDRWRAWYRQRLRWAAGQIQVVRRHRNILFRRLFGMPGLIGVPEMILSDVVVLYARFIWLAIVIMWNWHEIPKILALVASFYAILELLSAYIAGVTTSLKRDIKYILLLPLIVIVYRPLNDCVRLYAYSGELLQKLKHEW